MSSKTKVGFVDPRVIYPEVPKLKDATKQLVHGSEYVTLLPTAQTPSSYTFDIKSNGVILFGPFTGFQIEGQFMKKKQRLVIGKPLNWLTTPKFACNLIGLVI